MSTNSSVGHMPKPTLAVLAATSVSLLTKMSKTFYDGSAI